MTIKVDIEYIAKLPVCVCISFSDYNIPSENDFNFWSNAKEQFNNSQLEAILGILRPCEVPVGFDLTRCILSSYGLFMKSNFEGKNDYRWIYGRHTISYHDKSEINYHGDLTKLLKN